MFAIEDLNSSLTRNFIKVVEKIFYEPFIRSIE